MKITEHNINKGLRKTNHMSTTFFLTFLEELSLLLVKLRLLEKFALLPEKLRLMIFSSNSNKGSSIFNNPPLFWCPPDIFPPFF